MYLIQLQLYSILITTKKLENAATISKKVQKYLLVYVPLCTHIQTKPATFFQNNKKLSPKNWLGKSSMEVVKQWIFELEDI